jgi:hypothetical protein
MINYWQYQELDGVNVALSEDLHLQLNSPIPAGTDYNTKRVLKLTPKCELSEQIKH